MGMNLLKKLTNTQSLALLITFFVAFNSIIYELLFAQALSVVFGSTVVSYSITIGLFMASLGVGAFVFGKFFAGRSHEFTLKTFVFVEIFLFATAVLGVLFILFLSAFTNGNLLNDLLIETLAYLPIVVVGVLSGLELPLMVAFGRDNSLFASVLGIDYFGSLSGTVIYSLVLYPYLGLLSTTFIVALFNFLIAMFVALFLYKKNTTFYISLLLSILFIAGLYLGQREKINSYIESLYMGKVIEEVYAEYGVTTKGIKLVSLFRTPYQLVSKYKVLFPGDFVADTCINLDRHLQACGNWTESYHHGLVDVPLSIFPENKKLKVLVLGGGDFIPANFLRKHDKRIVSVDMVDIDRRFQDFAKKDNFLLKYNQKAFEYDKLNLHIGDAFSFMRQNREKYDLILIDLPGIKHDKLLPLYSKEFFTFIKRSLANDGYAAYWYYPEDMYPTHAAVLNKTLREAGFEKRLNYTAYKLQNNRPVLETEKFFVLSGGKFGKINTNPNAYTFALRDIYSKSEWQDIVTSNVKANSIFEPNYGIIVGKPEHLKKS